MRRVLLLAFLFVSFLSFGADVTRYVNTDSTAGGDGTTNATTGANRAYATMAEWESAEDGGSHGGDDMILYFSAPSGTADTSRIHTGWDFTYDSVIVQPLTEADAATHEWDDTRYRLSYTDATIISMWGATSSCPITLKSLQMEILYTSTSNQSCVLLQGGEADLTIDSCYFKVASQQRGMLVNDLDAVVLIKNSIFTGGDTNLYFNNGTTVDVFNTISHGAASEGILIGANGGTVTLTNNAIFSNLDDIDDSASSTITYCAGDDADFSSGTGNIQPSDWANEFPNAATGDFTPSSGGDIEDAGIGPGSDANVPTLDMSGETRSGATCDIGPNEITASGSTYALTATDGTSVSDTLSALADFITSLIDGITSSDTGNVLIGALIAMATGVIFIEAGSAKRISQVSQVDAITATDSGSSSIDFVITAADGVAASDLAAMIAEYVTTSVDGISASDVTTSAGDIPGSMVVTISAKEAKINITVKGPGIRFTEKDPGIDITEE